MDVSEAKCYTQLKWNIILIQKVEILKMVSKMSSVRLQRPISPTYSKTNTLVLTFYGCFEAK